MKSCLRVLCLLAITGSVSGQIQQTVYFSTRFAETPASGRGGHQADQTAPCIPSPTFGTGFVIESAVANSQGVSYVTPGAVNTTVLNSNPPQQVTDFVEVSNFPQFNLYLGDLDADGIAHESTNFRGIDAMYIPDMSTGRPNNIHEMFVSCYADSTGSSGYAGSTITESDVFLLPASETAYPVNSAGQPPVYFIRRGDWQTLLNSTATLDVNAFTVDQTTGDIYCSFDGSNVGTAEVVTVSGSVPSTIALTRGDIVRIPGTAYTATGPFGVVTSPVPGQAELVYTQAEVAAMVTAAGGVLAASSSVNPVSVYGLSLDPNGGVSATPSGFVVPNLYFTVDNRGGTNPGIQNPTSSAIYSNQGGGAFAVLNGVIMSEPNAAGIDNAAFNGSYFSGPMDALSVGVHTPTLDPLLDRPVHLDAYPTNGVIGGFSANYQGTLTGYVSGLPPGAIAAVLIRLDVVPAGGWISRTNVSATIPGYPDLYVDPFGFANQSCILAPNAPPFTGVCASPFQAVARVVFNNPSSGITNDPSQMINPVPVHTDPTNGVQNGDTCFRLDLSGVIAPGAMPPAPPIVLTVQVLDLSSVRLSSPMAFQLN